MGTGTIITAAALALALLLLVVLLMVVLRQRRPPGDTQSASLIQDQIAALRQETSKALTDNTQAVNQRVADLTGQLNQRLSEINQGMRDTTGTIDKRLDATQEVMRNVYSSLGVLKEATDLPIAAQPNAGAPEVKDGVTVFPESPEQMAGYAVRFKEAGVSILGGCCGSIPEYIALARSNLGL